MRENSQIRDKKMPHSGVRQVFQTIITSLFDGRDIKCNRFNILITHLSRDHVHHVFTVFGSITGFKIG